MISNKQLNVRLPDGSSVLFEPKSDLAFYETIDNLAVHLGISKDKLLSIFKFQTLGGYNLFESEHAIENLEKNVRAGFGEFKLELAVCGGKGGFGSMLRAQGAEKEEKDKKERIKRKIEKDLAVPAPKKVFFDDSQYEKNCKKIRKSTLNATDKAIKLSTGSASKKGKGIVKFEDKTEAVVPLLFGEEMLDFSDSSSDSEACETETEAENVTNEPNEPSCSKDQ
ncbi:hypothetical protein AYI69_g7337 [Smittium culicis]|uniref:Uncharacterized protein n=1 Tax=Smittium culicis TaxID=133412 RepID=A0A1R1XSQ0_9FUNG|nr:hypothetical protein AYI69_g7337 [Smittium culicis]